MTHTGYKKVLHYCTVRTKQSWMMGDVLEDGLHQRLRQSGV